MSLPESLERAASEMDGLADKIRPANGDPHRLLADLDASEASALLVWMLSTDPDSAAELIEDWGEADMSDWRTLRDFGVWAADHVPARHYMYIAWDHGAGCEDGPAR